MLFFKTIPAQTLELLTKIPKIEIFKNMRLVEGTALALQINHRMSNDLDFFGSLTADKISILNELKKIGQIKTLNSTENINIFLVDNIKVDIVNYPYAWLENEIKENKLRLADIKDIAAMKLSAITGRGTKKDFIDLFFLLKIFSLEQLFDLYENKYPDGSKFLVLKSLTYFDDAEDDIPPKMLTSISWDEVKESIIKNVMDFVRNQSSHNE